MKSYEKLLLQNKAWVAERTKSDKDFFKRHSVSQTPDFLWIGCSDSRIPVNEVTGTEPGEIFVHRNIANLVIHTDLNLLSVLQYAVEVLKVKHVIVCGHYGCGGIRAAMTNENFGLINKWLRNIKETYCIHQEELEKIGDNTKRADRLTELSVMEQVKNLSKTSIIQRAWKKEGRPSLRGWVYHIENGMLEEVYNMKPGDEIDPIFQYHFAE